MEDGKDRKRKQEATEESSKRQKTDSSGGDSSNPVLSIENDTPSCTICLDTSGGDSLEYLPCSHSFHSQCINRWFRRKQKCPMCRTRMSDYLGMDTPTERSTPVSRYANRTHGRVRTTSIPRRSGTSRWNHRDSDSDSLSSSPTLHHFTTASNSSAQRYQSFLYGLNFPGFVNDQRSSSDSSDQSYIYSSSDSISDQSSNCSGPDSIS